LLKQIGLNGNSHDNRVLEIICEKYRLQCLISKSRKAMDAGDYKKLTAGKIQRG